MSEETDYKKLYQVAELNRKSLVDFLKIKEEFYRMILEGAILTPQNAEILKRCDKYINGPR